MADYNSDEAKEFRRARLLKINPKAAPMMINESDFRRDYTEYRFVSIEHSPTLEETNHVMFCPACVKDVNSQMRKVRVLYVSYEEDPLGNFPLIAVAKCQGCEWEEMIPVVKQEITSEDQQLLRRYHNAVANQGITLAPGLWSSQMIETFKDSDSILQRIGKDGSMEYVPDGPVRFGQNKANRVWEEISKQQEEIRSIETARAQIETIERIEAEQRASVQNRAAVKAASMGQMYGMGQQGMNDLMNNYRRDMADQMRKQIDADMTRQMQNMAFTDDEIAKLKKEPAEAAKAAHRTLLDKVKVAFRK